MLTFNNQHQSKLFTSLLIAIILVNLVSEAGVKAMETSDSSIDITEPQKVLGKHIFKLGENLINNLNNDAKSNLVLSPLSIHSAVSMLSLGAKPGSETQNELINFLGYKNFSNSGREAHEAYLKVLTRFKEITNQSESSSSEDGSRYGRPPVIDFWSMAVADKGAQIKDSYKDALKKYMSDIKQVKDEKEASATADQINDWGKKTGFTSDLTKPKDFIGDPGSINLLSAVRVQGWWFDSMFDIKAREGTTFFNHGDPKQEVKDMHVLVQHDLHGVKYAIFSNDPKYDCVKNTLMRGGGGEKDAKQLEPAILEELNQLEFQVIEIPMRGDISFGLIEPLKDSTEASNELAKLERVLFGRSLLKKAMHHVRRTNLETFIMPQLKIENNLDLADLLSKSGLSKTLSPEAELTEIAERSMIVKQANHKAVIEVDKNGIKGGALTSIKVMPLSLTVYSCPIKVTVRRPFFFFLRYGRLVLFMGHLVEL